jgi:hypothetical protein
VSYEFDQLMNSKLCVNFLIIFVSGKEAVAVSVTLVRALTSAHHKLAASRERWCHISKYFSQSFSIIL